MKILPSIMLLLATLALPVNGIAALATACGPTPATVQLIEDGLSADHAGVHSGHDMLKTETAETTDDGAGLCCEGCVTACSSACGGATPAPVATGYAAAAIARHGMQSADLFLPGPDPTVLKRPPKPGC
ncbi:MAG: hypothetical protein HKN35_11535 [Woeseia sp.]|nr:hypothetical protein [Woeseia sp.]MBT8095643.1 hypothetical protein [Woeseia sp.]NNE61521.1 hypothetical protein [Woeseia sp.]NNL54117.1 hypothetical protein [Woeseia sp.]